VKLRPVRAVESAAGRKEPGGLVSKETTRLLPLLAPVSVSGLALAGLATWSFAASSPTLAVMGGVLALLLAATFVEAHPVPIEGINSEGISLAAVFIVGAGVLYGWAPAVVVGCLTPVLIEVIRRRPVIRLAYNGAVYALAG